MSTGESLDSRLDGLLERRKRNSTYRSLKEYRTVQTASDRAGSSKDELIDFVRDGSARASFDSDLPENMVSILSLPMTTYPSPTLHLSEADIFAD
jgi:hypothetical protein